MVQLANPFSLLAEKHVSKDGAAEENAAKASFLASEKMVKDEKKKQKHRPRRRPGSLKSSNGSQNDNKGTDSVSVASSTSLNDVVDQTQTRENNNEEATKEANPDAEGWQVVQYQKKKGTRNGNHGQTQANQVAILNNQFNVKEGIKQLQEVAKGMNGSQGVKSKKPNMNGSARRRLQKNKAGSGQVQEVQANKETTNTASPDATETAPVEKKLTVTYTLEEYEMMKKNGNINKSEEQHHQSAEKDKSYKGAEKDKSYKERRKQPSGSKLNGDVEDVSPAIVEKVVDMFTMNPVEFPILGKQGRAL